MTPGEAIRAALQVREWTQADLSQVIGRPVAAINEVMQGKRGVTADMALALASALGGTADYWMGLDAAYWLSKADGPSDEIARRAKLFSLAPIKDMQRRGWIQETQTTGDLERELKQFFQTDDLDAIPDLSASARKTDIGVDMNAAQKTWCVRSARLAKLVPAAHYSSTSIDRAVRDLKKLITWPEEAQKVPRVLGDAGIRFVVVEHLPHTKIDGAAFWINETMPVIALSLRFDRIDCFWHTLAHELSHIRHRDRATVDVAMVGEGAIVPGSQTDIELRADREAACTWIEDGELDDFIGRVSPLYDKTAINQFANRIRVHPGVIVGQLQHRGELSYSAMRQSLVKIRDIVTAETLTDGWGHSV